MSQGSNASLIDSSEFYIEWKGHKIEHLTQLFTTTRSLRPNSPIIYLAGDSSLDNKAWVTISETLPVPVPEIYKHVLRTTASDPAPKPDIAFWLNHLLGARATCINTAVEESLLRERDKRLLPHDEFIRDHVTPNDFLVVSIGANDIALRPNGATIMHMLDLVWATRKTTIQEGTACSLRHFRRLFKDQVQNYIERLCEKQKPKAVIVCMIYYPLEASGGQGGWANMQLKALGYDQWPGQLQATIKQIYETATKEIKIEGTTVMPCPLFEVLDGKKKEEYTARVEPNEEGGRLMAMKFVDMLKDQLNGH